MAVTKKTTPVKKVVAKPVIDEDLVVTIPVEAEDEKGPEKYYQATGRRKESIARIRLFTKKSTDAASEERAIVTVNNKNYTEYFTDVHLQHVVESPLRKLKS